ncbi:hypothetical protein EYF80_034734 [Liparis tanakae]|uniref:Uncharacterized protein n=1 Tax=Liparis tanakae TaxID=230148 RepID=A0A4Z2GN29_9TELE|nr:hypothetical protein EYF80_034734 [Liparis tanakae]
MGTAGRGLLLPRQNRSPRSVLEKSDPYWKEMMLSKNMKGHPRDQHRLDRKTERGGREREEGIGGERKGWREKERHALLKPFRDRGLGDDSPLMPGPSHLRSWKRFKSAYHGPTATEYPLSSSGRQTLIQLLGKVSGERITLLTLEREAQRTQSRWTRPRAELYSPSSCFKTSNPVKMKH